MASPPIAIQQSTHNNLICSLLATSFANGSKWALTPFDANPNLRSVTGISHRPLSLEVIWIAVPRGSQDYGSSRLGHAVTK